MKKRALIDNITNQMVIGIQDLKRSPISKEEYDKFKSAFLEVVKWVKTRTPKSSAGLQAAIAKAVLWYGIDKIEPFCYALKNSAFNGKDDPVHVLYLYLSSQVKYNPRDVYRRTVTAIRYYVDGRIMKDHKGIYPAESDIFDWNPDYTRMIRYRPNESKSVQEALTMFIEETTVRQ